MTLRSLAVILATLWSVGCGGPPSDSSLRDSFAAQMAANKFLTNVQRDGDDITFSGAGAEGGTAKWRVHIDKVEVEETGNADVPYKGTVRSSWYSDGALVSPRGRDSNLPVELTSNELAQVCWALWEKGPKRWSWE